MFWFVDFFQCACVYAFTTRRSSVLDYSGLGGLAGFWQQYLGLANFLQESHPCMTTHSYSKNPHKNSFMSAFLQKLRKILMKHMRRYGENENILVRRAFLNWYVYARALVSVLKVVCLSVMCAREGVRKCTCIRECTVMRRNPKVNEFSLTTPHAQG